jgi:hypothetical protein
MTLDGGLPWRTTGDIEKVERLAPVSLARGPHAVEIVYRLTHRPAAIDWICPPIEYAPKASTPITDSITTSVAATRGILVNLIEHNSNTFGGAEPWNLRNRNNQVVASGVYFYMIEAGDARRVGRFTVVNFAQ